MVSPFPVSQAGNKLVTFGPFFTFDFQRSTKPCAFCLKTLLAPTAAFPRSIPGMAFCFPFLPGSSECQLLVPRAYGENVPAQLLANSTLLLFPLLKFSSSYWTKNQIHFLQTAQPHHAVLTHPAAGPSSLEFPVRAPSVSCAAPAHSQTSVRVLLHSHRRHSPELPPFLSSFSSGFHWFLLVSFLLAFKFALLGVTLEVSWM